ncbi:MAG: hypothetical protein AB7P76_12975 [Candidatus Melainabacteria bacterium]
METQRHYIDVILKFHIFYFAITGGILSYYLAHSGIDKIIYSLYLPWLMACLFSGLFSYGLLGGFLGNEAVASMIRTLDLVTDTDMNYWVAYDALIGFLIISIILLLITAFGLAWLLGAKVIVVTFIWYVIVILAVALVKKNHFTFSET